jgi:HAD superfamily hydrolase (TIGR01509 family)
VDSPSLIIFDCDGVLVDSEGLASRVMADAICELGLATNEAAVLEDFKGLRMQTCLEIISARLGRPLPASFEAQLRSRTAAAFRLALRSVQGIESALDRIGIEYCVASSGPIDKIRLSLELTGLLPRFEGRIFSAYEIGSWKPDPGLFLHASATMGATPACTVVVEDSLVGVQAARAAGMRVLAYASGWEGDLLAAQGASVFDDMAKLPELIANLFYVD